MDFLEYNDVSAEYRGGMQGGKLKLTDEKLTFKASSDKRSETIKSDEMEIVNWQRLAGSWGIRIFTEGGNLFRYAGFKEGERERLAKFFSNYYKLDMLDRELSVKGWNWGTANFNGGVLGFEAGGKADAFEIPLQYVNQCNSGKNEVALEFHHNDDSSVILAEMRFHIPTSELAGGDDAVEVFKDKVMERASVVTTTGDAIVIFRDINCLTPKGRYDIKIFPSQIHLHGKTFDYKMAVSSVMRLFLLPHKDQRQMHFCINVDPPIKQGQTRYHYLIMNFRQEETIEVELPFTDEEIAEKFDGKLEKEMTGQTHDVISRIMKAVSRKKVTVPGSFLGHSGTPAVTCSHKAASGFIYPLERGMLFVYKPPIYIRYDEVRTVSFERSGASTRSFDITVDCTTSEIGYTFSSIEKGEYGRMYDFFKEKKIKLKTSGAGGKSGLNFDEKPAVDHHLAKVKAEADELSSDNGSMSSDDTDFNPDALEALSAREEYDSEPTTTSSEDSSDDEGGTASDRERKREEKKKAKAEKKEKKAAAKVKRAAKSSGGGGGGGSRKKKTKLPGQPKKNLSAYFIWMQENREKIKKDNPGLSLTEMTKKSGELWREMKDKSEWEKKAADDKKRYEDEYKKWFEDGGKEAIAKAKSEAKAEKRKSKSGGAAPKKSSGGSSAPKSKTVSQATGTAGYKSKEFIEDSDSSSDDGDKKSSSPAKKKEDAGSGSGSGSGSESGGGSAKSGSAKSGSDSD